MSTMSSSSPRPSHKVRPQKPTPHFGGRFVPPPESERLEQYERMWADIRQRLNVPMPEKLYTPKPALGGPHPRYLLAGGELDRLRERTHHPEAAGLVSVLRGQAIDLSVAPLDRPESMDVEDPLRDYGNRLSTLAFGYLIENDSETKSTLLAGVVRHLDTFASWPLPLRDLPLSHFMLGVSTAYDWLYDVLPVETRFRARAHLIAMARFMRSPANVSAWEWRGQEEWLANHKWYNYAALGVAAAVLWGETEASLDPAEPKLWMDEAMEVFCVVSRTLGHDGAPLEGYLYQAYGSRPYFDMAIVSDQLTDCTEPLLDLPAVRNQGMARLHCLLPNRAGFHCWGDSYPRAWGGSAYLRLIASRFNEPLAQCVAEIVADPSLHLPNPLQYNATPPRATLPRQSSSVGDAVVVEVQQPCSTYGLDRDELLKRQGESIATWQTSQTLIKMPVELKTGGAYALALRYAAACPVIVCAAVNGGATANAATVASLPGVGDWSCAKILYRNVLLGDNDLVSTWRLEAGVHEIELRFNISGGVIVDQVALVPAGFGEAQACGLLRQSDADGPSGKDADWRELLWQDRSVQPATLADLPHHHDFDDLGLSTARSDWEALDATYFGLKCGPASGKSVLDLCGPGLTSGHVQPDAGTFVFYCGSSAIVPAANYITRRLTTNHSVVVFEGVGPEKGQQVGQYGEGGRWFGHDQFLVQPPPRILRTNHDVGLHSYLCDLGGAYPLYDHRLEEDWLRPEYRRSITYLESGAFVIVDRVRTPVPRSCQFRLLTGVNSLSGNGRSFQFEMGPNAMGSRANVQGSIIDYSPATWQRSISTEILSSWMNPHCDPPVRRVLTLRAVEQRVSIFAVVLGVNRPQNDVQIDATEEKVLLKLPGKSPLIIPWEI